MQQVLPGRRVLGRLVLQDQAPSFRASRVRLAQRVRQVRKVPTVLPVFRASLEPILAILGLPVPLAQRDHLVLPVLTVCYGAQLEKSAPQEPPDLQDRLESLEQVAQEVLPAQLELQARWDLRVKSELRVTLVTVDLPALLEQLGLRVFLASLVPRARLENLE